MNRHRIAVLRGGPSEEYEVSMRTGANVLRSLLAQPSYSPLDIVITKEGEWLQAGVAKDPAKILDSADTVFIALHGSYGEDGEVQKLLQRYNLPFTGSRAFPSAVAFNKHMTKTSLQKFGVRMPEHIVVTSEQIEDLAQVVKNIESSFGPEYIVKPLASGSSYGIEVVKIGASLENALRFGLTQSSQVMVEEFIRGREATVAVLEDFRTEPVYAFPAIEIIPPREADFFSTKYKYNGQTKEICPANFAYSERTALADMAVGVHEALGLSQYSRSDFIIRDGQVYFLEVNTLPGLTEESLYPKAAAAVGMNLRQLVAHLVDTAKI